MIKKLPLFGAKSKNRELVMDIYNMAYNMSHSNNTRYVKKLILNKERNVAFYDNNHTIKTMFIDDVVAYHASDLSKAMGLAAGSKRLRHFSKVFDDIHYVTKNDIKEFVSNSTLNNKHKSRWEDFLKAAKS